MPTPTFDPGEVILPILEVPIPTPPALADNPLEMTLDGIDLRVNVLRQLTSLRPVSRQFVTREKLRDLLLEEFEEDREDIAADQRLYVALGILDQDADLFGLFLDLYGEGVLGFYDAEIETFYMVLEEEDGFEPSDIRTYAHEFVHALQQQHFDFYATFEALEDNSDGALALRALLEGDASLLERVYLFEHMTEAERDASQSEPSSSLIRAFRAVPHVVQRFFLYPYQEGFLFALEVFRTGEWDAVDQAFEELPQSTEQILHPEKYFAGHRPITVELPDLTATLGEGWSEVERNTMGEFFLMSYLETDLSNQKASPAAQGWGGDRFSLLKGPLDEIVLVLSIAWDTGDDALEFFDTFLESVQVRTGAVWDIAGDGQEASITTRPDQRVFIELDGKGTVMIFAPDQALLEATREGLTGVGVAGE